MFWRRISKPLNWVTLDVFAGIQMVTLWIKSRTSRKPLCDLAWIRLFIARTMASNYPQQQQEEHCELAEKKQYQSLIAALLYIAINTRPDIAIATSVLGRLSDPFATTDTITVGVNVGRIWHQDGHGSLVQSWKSETLCSADLSPPIRTDCPLWIRTQLNARKKSITTMTVIVVEVAVHIMNNLGKSRSRSRTTYILSCIRMFC